MDNAPLIRENTLLRNFLGLPMTTVYLSIRVMLPGDYYLTSDFMNIVFR